ncbi:MAG: TIGR00282 family metallophosphoesterase, partial [Patescibacteria group bacterium]
MKVLFIGDVNGSIGRKTVAKILPKLKKDLKLDLAIANADNIAHGSGVTEKTIKELMDAGVNYFTNGDHAFDKTSSLDCYDTQPIIRPANFPEGVPGQGYKIIELGKYKILLINLIGRVFMDRDYDCPFRKADEILAMFAKKKLSAIIIDMHAEATSENVSLGHYLDGQVSAIFGTHTHIMTADNKVTEKGTAYITDVGMVGADNECIGVAKEGIIKTFLTQIKNTHVIPEKGKAIFNAVLVN